jgi:hypothetical protein
VDPGGISAENWDVISGCFLRITLSRSMIVPTSVSQKHPGEIQTIIAFTSTKSRNQLFIHNSRIIISDDT